MTWIPVMRGRKTEYHARRGRRLAVVVNNATRGWMYRIEGQRIDGARVKCGYWQSRDTAFEYAARALGGDE